MARLQGSYNQVHYSVHSWWRLQPVPESIEPHWKETDYWQPSATKVPGEGVIAFAPNGRKPLRFLNLEAAEYKASFWNPSDGSESNRQDQTR